MDRSEDSDIFYPNGTEWNVEIDMWMISFCASVDLESCDPVRVKYESENSQVTSFIFKLSLIFKYLLAMNKHLC